MAKFKPTLAIDATNNLDNIKYPKFASYKLDGIRAIFHPELELISRSLKSIQNKQLNEKFEYLKIKSKEKGIIIDGEFYHHKLNFQVITALVMTQDFMDEKTFKKLNKPGNKEDRNYSEQNEKNRLTLLSYYKYSKSGIIESFNNPLQYHIFDSLDEINNDVFWERQIMIDSNFTNTDEIKIVEQIEVKSKDEVMELFKKALNDGYEGLILKDPNSPYKFGRSTLNEEYSLKVKPFETFDAQIIGVQQATEVDVNAEKTVNELGRSVTSKKKGDRVLIEKASAFFVKYNDNELKVNLAMNDKEKEEVWKNKEDYTGRWIEYKGMMIGAKDVPRHPVFVRFRDDKK